jgi:hypothetical protein
MIDPNFKNPEQLQRLHQQKMEAMKVLMSEIIDNPSMSNASELKKVIDYLDKDSNNSEKND